TWIAIACSSALDCLEDLRIGRARPTEKLEALRAGRELIGGAGLDMRHGALDKILARRVAWLHDRAAAGHHVVDGLHRVAQRLGAGAGLEPDAHHRAKLRAGARPDHGARRALAVDDRHARAGGSGVENLHLSAGFHADGSEGIALSKTETLY